NLRPGDRVGLIVSSDPGRAKVEISGNFGAAIKELKEERPSFRRGDLEQAFRTGLDLLAGAENPRRRLLVVSDFQASQVARGAWASLAQVAASATRPVAIQLEGPSDRPLRKLANLAISSVRAKSDAWIEKAPTNFLVRIEN